MKERDWKQIITEQLGAEFSTGRHVLLNKVRSGPHSDEYHCAAVVDGKFLRYRHVVKPEMVMQSFLRQFGTPDSVHQFESLEQAHAAFPKFYLNPHEPSNWEFSAPIGL